MKKFIFAIVLSAVLAGCSQSSVSDEVTLQDRIEDFSNYTVVTDANAKSFVSACDVYSEAFAQKVKDGEVKKLSLYSSSSDWSYDLKVYMTPNYDNWTKADFDKVNKCGELGSVLVRSIVSDSLLWSYPRCSAGAVPNTDEPAYQQFLECSAVEEQLVQYFTDKL